jgi:hypothetical protein
VQDKNIKFYQLLEVHLNAVIQKTLKESDQKDLTTKLIREVRDSLNQAVSTIFGKSKYKLSTEALSWLTNQFFKRIKINEDQIMNDQVVINDYDLSELTFDDIQLLHNLFIETQMGPELDSELRKRNLS